MRNVVSLIKYNEKSSFQRLIICSSSIMLLLWGLFIFQESETRAKAPTKKLGTTESPSSSKQSAEKKIPLVQVTRPQHRDSSTSISLPANVSPWEQVTIYGKVSGYIKSMKFRVGDTVQKGEVMGVIDAPEYQENFEKAQEEYKIKALTYQRLKAVWTINPDAIAKQDLDMAEAQAKAAKNLMENKRDLLQYTKIQAPFTGTVTGRFADPGILIQSATGSGSQAIPLYTFMDFSTVRVFVNVPQEVPKLITPGFPVTLISQDLGQWQLNSTVTRTTNALDSGTKTLLVEIDLPNKNGRLIPGMLLTATFHFQTEPHALVIPNEAILQNDQNSSSSIFIAKDGQARRIDIKTGNQKGNWTEVLEGLTGKEDVIVNQDTLTDGQKVRTTPYHLPNDNK